MIRIISAFAVIACFASCKKEPTHYCYNVYQDTALNNVIIADSRFEKHFKNEDEAHQYQIDNKVYCELIK